jgi:serine/threonine protein kinase
MIAGYLKRIPEENGGSSLSWVTAVLLSRNTTFAEFKLRGHRGSGGFSDVYEAVGDNGKRVAIKVLRVTGGSSATNMERFERELRILQRMDNRRIARLVAAKLDSDPPWIASEYIDGPNLREAVDEKGHFSTKDAVQIFSVVVKALSEIHSEGIAHRDITPNNILLGEYGPVIIDFGSAKENLTGDVGSVLSVGTPDFAAPEVLDGANAGLASDVYSLAKVFNFLLGSVSDEHTRLDDDGISAIQSEAISKCLLQNPQLRPAATDLVEVFPITDIDVNLISTSYSKVEISKLPRRISVKALVATVCFTAATVGLCTALLVRSDSKPVTVKMIEERASEFSADIFLEKNELKAGWLLAGPTFADAPLRYENPNFLDMGPSVLGLEGYISNVMPRNNYLEIKVELLRFGLAQSSRKLDLTTERNYPLKNYEVFADKFKNFINDFQKNYTIGSCNVMKTEEFALQITETGPRIRLIGMLDRCRWESVDVSGYAVMDIYPLQDVVVYTTVNSRIGVVDLQTLLGGFEVSGESIIHEATENHAEMFSDRSSDSFALDTSDTSNSGGHQLFARRAFRIPSDSAAEISRSLSGSLLTNSGGHSPVSVYFYNEFDLEPGDTPQVDDFIFPFGQIIELQHSESRIFSNDFDADMVLLAEVNQTNRLSTDFQIKIKNNVAETKQFFFSDDFSGSGSKVQDGTVAARSFMFGLPTSQSGDDQKRGDFRAINGIRYPVPYDWVIASDSLNTPSTGLLIHANPFGWPLDSVRADMPRLEVFDADLNELFLRKGFFLWWLADYEGCSSPPFEFIKKVGRVEISWKVLDDCSIPTEYYFGLSKRQKARQANPIIKFLISSKVGPQDGDFEIGVAMGEFVPEMDTGVAFWEEMVETIASQSERINALAVKKCFNAFSDPKCLIK